MRYQAKHLPALTLPPDGLLSHPLPLSSSERGGESKWNPPNGLILGSAPIDSWLRSFCGNSSGLLLALLLLVLLDYITGICVAIQTKQLSSQIGAKGITKKVAMFVVIAFCHVLDAYLLHAEAALETVSTIFYLSNEGISILENVGKLGVPLPQKVQTLLSYLKKSGDNDPPS